MSIIYDALQKIQKIRPQASGIRSPKNRTFYLLSMLMLLAGFFLARLIFDTFISKVEMKEAHKIEPQQPAAPASARPPHPPEAQKAPAVAKEAVRKPVPAEKKGVPPALSLNGIFFDELRPYVLINNKILKEGDTVEGAKVVQILPDRVYLDFEGQPLELTVAQ
jgi:hypothetical protein